MGFESRDAPVAEEKLRAVDGGVAFVLPVPEVALVRGPAAWRGVGGVAQFAPGVVDYLAWCGVSR